MRPNEPQTPITLDKSWGQRHGISSNAHKVPTNLATMAFSAMSAASSEDVSSIARSYLATSRCRRRTHRQLGLIGTISSSRCGGLALRRAEGAGGLNANCAMRVVIGHCPRIAYQIPFQFRSSYRCVGPAAGDDIDT